MRLLTVVDEYSRDCLAIRVARRLNSQDVVRVMAELFVPYGVPRYLRSDNGVEMTTKAVRRFLAEFGVETLYIAPGSPWESGYIESFNGKLRPHSSLGYKPPAPEAIQPPPLTAAV